MRAALRHWAGADTDDPVVTAEDLLGLDEVDVLAPRRGGGDDSGVSGRVAAVLLTELPGGTRDVTDLAPRPLYVMSVEHRPSRARPRGSG